MGQCIEKPRSERSSMSHSTKHLKKKVKQETADQRSTQWYRQTNSTASIEPRRDIPLNKIPELLAKITGTFSSTVSSSLNVKQLSSSSLTTSPDRRLQLFKHYAINNEESMSIDGIVCFCNDLSLEPDCYEVLLFCFLCRAKQMYILTKEEFLLGLKTLGNEVDNLTDLRTSLFNYNIFPFEQEFYIWTYHFGLIDGQRCIATSNAISLWRLFYSKHVEKPPVLDRWLNYLEEDLHNDVPKTITCDTWTIFPQFAKFIHLNGYAAYDDNEAWPCLFDGFVEKQLGQQPQTETDMSATE